VNDAHSFLWLDTLNDCPLIRIVLMDENVVVAPDNDAARVVVVVVVVVCIQVDTIDGVVAVNNSLIPACEEAVEAAGFADMMMMVVLIDISKIIYSLVEMI
jgi:hypothetical protein